MAKQFIIQVRKCDLTKAEYIARYGIEKYNQQVRRNSENDKHEGVRLPGCIGTHLTGPVLIKNPHFLAYLAEKVLGRAPATDWLTYERAGFAVTLSELRQRAAAVSAAI